MPTATLSKEEIAERGHPVWAEVDLGALAHNVRTLKEIAAPAELMAVVKGYAYGHGNPTCAQAMLDAGATRLGVARVAEALHLREAGVSAPILVFTEPPPEAIPAILANDLTVGVYTQRFAAALSDAARETNAPAIVHVKIDTGMHRVGVPAEEAAEAVRSLKDLTGLDIEGAWSHLAVADVPDHPFTKKQLDTFEKVIENIERAGTTFRVKHIANSAATVSIPQSHLDLVRCGVACFGLAPGPALPSRTALRPALALRARINMVKEVAAGDALSYGLDYRMKNEARVATVPAGYADGYDRGLSGKADVLISGKRYRVSGAVCMDQFMVDVGEDDVEVGQIATLLGRDGEEEISAEELAERIGTINYEITARVASRVPRLYVGG